MASFNHSYALVIGIDAYERGITPLNNAVNDASAIADLLEANHDYTVWRLFDQAASREHIQHYLKTYLPQQIQAEDRLLFYFSGHGIQLSTSDGPEGYLIPQTAQLGESNTYLPMHEISQDFHALPCRHLLVILDCCFAGSFRWSSQHRKATVLDSAPLYKERYDRYVRDYAWQVLTSAAYDQLAYDAFDLKNHRGQDSAQPQHSPFATTLLDALGGAADISPPAKKPGDPPGDGVTTATEIYQYTRDLIEPPTDARGMVQTPELCPLGKHGRGEYIFLIPGHPLNLPPAPPLDSTKNPYRGLQSFDAQHCDLFFGRSALVNSLEAFVALHSLTIVLGASGSGKSSLVKAGLIPLLTQHKQERWCVLAPIRPGEHPFQSLNEALLGAGLLSTSPAGEQTLEKSISSWVSNHPKAKLLIFIDQSEEIITLCSDEKVRQDFFQQILTAISAHRDQLRVVLSLRADFESQVRDAGLSFIPEVLNQVGSEALKHRWQQGRFWVPAMTRSELREAIERPAEARVMHFEPYSLVDRLIEEVADMPGALPLLSFTLSELYLKYLERQGHALSSGECIDRALTLTDYQSLGGVVQSLTQRADEEYRALVKEDAKYAQVIRHVMLRLVALNGGEVARRRVRLSELVYPVEQQTLAENIITRFTQARLLVEGQDSAGNACVEAAHDALIRGWHKLQNWLEREKNLALQRRLTTSATEWNHRRHPRFLWHTSPYLDVLNQTVLQSTDNNWLNALETRFVKQSLRKRNRNSIIRWSLISTAFILLSSVSGIAIRYAVSFQNSLIGSLGGSAQSMFASNEGLDALAQAVDAGEHLLRMPNFLIDPWAKGEVVHALQETLYGIKERKRFDYASALTSVDVSPSNNAAAVGLENGTIVLKSLEGETFTTLLHGTDAVSNVSFSNNGKVLVSGTRTQGIKVWQQRDGLFKPVRDIMPDEAVMSLAVSETAQIIATANIPSADGSSDAITLWNMEGLPVATFGQDVYLDRINSLSFSADGQRLATGSDETIKVWDLSRNNQLISTISTGQKISTVLFVDNQTIASGSMNGIVSLWGIDGIEKALKESHRGEIYNLAIDKDRKILASASQDQTVNVWDLENRNLVDTFSGHEGEVTDISFGKDRDTLISASTDESARLWKVGHNDAHSEKPLMTGYVIDLSQDGETVVMAEGNELHFWALDDTDPTGESNGTDKHQSLAAHSDTIKSIRISPSISQQPNLLVSADAAGEIKLWDLNGKLLKAFSGHDDFVADLDFSPDGRSLISGGGDRKIKLWSTEGRLLDTWTAGSPITSVTFSPDGKRIISAEYDGVVRLWHLDGTHREKEPVESDIVDIEFSPDGKKFVAARTDGYVTLWHLNQPSPFHTFRADREAIRSVKFSADGRRLFSGGEDGEIKQWTLEGDLVNVLYRYDAGVSDMAFSLEKETIATVSALSDTTPSIVVRELSLDGLMDSSYHWLSDFLKTSRD